MTTTAPTADERLAWIEAQIAAGRDIYVCGYTKAVRITPKTFAAWRDAGGFFRVMGKSLYMRRGRKSWDCLDFTVLKAA